MSNLAQEYISYEDTRALDQRTDLGWLYIDHRAGSVIRLDAIDADLAVDAVYAGLPPEPEAAPAESEA